METFIDLSKMYSYYLNKLFSSLPAKFIYSILVGIVGALIVTFFLSFLMFEETLLKIMPLVLGFNTAMTGYSLIDKTEDRLPWRSICVVSACLLVVLPVCLLFNQFNQFASITLSQSMIYGLIGGVCSSSGSWLAMKSRNLQQKKHLKGGEQKQR